MPIAYVLQGGRLSTAPLSAPLLMLRHRHD